MDNKRLDEAVEVALAAYDGAAFGPANAESYAMRAALLASHPVLLGEPVAWQRRWSADGVNVMAVKKADRPKGWHFHEITKPKCCADDVPLYAPSLGEGDGR